MRLSAFISSASLLVLLAGLTGCFPGSTGPADEQKEPKEGTVEAWGRSESNPIGGWYGLKKGLRGRFGVYVPPLMETLGLVEIDRSTKAFRIRAK